MRVGPNLFDMLSRLQTAALNPNRSESAASKQNQASSACSCDQSKPVVLAESLVRLLAGSAPTNPSTTTQTPATLGDITAVEAPNPEASSDTPPPMGSDAPTTIDGLPPPPVNDPPAPAPAPRPDSKGEKAHGVIKLLQDGHFKGVADLRLRLKHFEDLSAQSLSAPTPPKGKGKAYEKFLADYNAKFATATPELNEVA